MALNVDINLHSFHINCSIPMWKEVVVRPIEILLDTTVPEIGVQNAYSIP